MYAHKARRVIQRLIEDVGHLVLKVLGSHYDIKRQKREWHEKEQETNQEGSRASLRICP